MPRPMQDEDELTRDPDYEAALARFVEQNPDAPDALKQRALGPASPGGPPAPMAQPVAALTSMVPGASMPQPKRPEDMTPDELDAAVVAKLGPKSTWNSPPPSTPAGEAMFADLQAAGRASQKPPEVPDEPLPDVSMPLPPAPRPATPLGKTVQVGHAARVDVPQTAINRSALSAPIAPGEGRKEPPQLGAIDFPDGPLAADHPAVAKGLEAARSGAKAAPATVSAGDGDLEEALRAAAGRRFVAGMARAGGAMVGLRQDPGADALDQEADRPLQELQLRREFAAQGRARADAAADDDPASPQSQMAREVLSRMAPELSKHPSFQNLTAKRAKEIFPGVKELFEAQSRKDIEGMKVKGEIDKLKAKHAGGGAGGGLKPHELDLDFQKLGDAVSTVRGRANLNRTRQESLDRADRLTALVLGPNGDISNLTPQQLREAATSLATLIAQGGSSAVSQIDELVPQTLAAKWANVKQKYLNEPEGADAQAFLRNMLETAGRETKVIKQQIHEGQISSVPAFAHLRKADQARYNAILQGAGLDPSALDDAGLERAGIARPSAADAAGAGPKRISSAAEYNALPPGAEYIDPNGKHRKKGG